MSTEPKIIAGMTCYKATLCKTVPDGVKTITVWYTPEIPLAFGSKNHYGNLPGIILEMDDLITSFVCASIVLNPKESLSIDWPEDVELISESEYNKQSKTLV